MNSECRVVRDFGGLRVVREPGLFRMSSRSNYFPLERLKVGSFTKVNVFLGLLFRVILFASENEKQADGESSNDSRLYFIADAFVSTTLVNLLRFIECHKNSTTVFWNVRSDFSLRSKGGLSCFYINGYD